MSYVVLSVKLFRFAVFLCPFYTITVNKCTYLKNLLLCIYSLLFASRAHAGAGGEFWWCGTCRMNEGLNYTLVLR